MAQHRDSRMLERPDNPPGHLFFWKRELAVHGGYNVVTSSQNLFGPVQASVSQDVTLRPLENPESPLLLIQPINFVPLPLKILRFQSTSVGCHLAVVRNPKVLPSQRLCFMRHLLNCMHSVTVRSMTVECSADICFLEKYRKVMVRCGGDLPFALAQLRRDQLQTE